MPTYYEQRASAGLIVTEATAISKQGVGWVRAPGIFTDAHEAGWRPVTDAVHRKGGRIALQLWHMGRVSHPDFLGGELPVGPSAIAAAGESTTPQGKKPYVTPHALTVAELPGIAADYARAARRAIAAGFDGVEIHGANGYLLDQFIRDGSNRRDDAYGGSIANRWRFPLEVVRAVVDAIGAERTGLRISTLNPYNDMADSDPVATFRYGAEQLAALGIWFLHVVEPASASPRVLPHVRAAFPGPIVLNGGRELQSGNAALAEGEADAIAFASKFLANPDLPERLRQNAALNPPQYATLYTPGPVGYLDYPSLAET
jgi:N-ethylmaleimide reductase